MTSEFDAYFEAVAAADAGAAADLLAAALERGEPRQRLIRDVIIPAQRRVGEFWASGAWNVADEHAATAVSEHALTLLANPRPRRPARRVVLACAESEWHTLPARLAANLAANGDMDIVMLGGSIPAEYLRQYLRGRRPDALALSCTMPMNLLGASRSIGAARTEGIPVIVGGAAWGTGEHRAQRLGADLRLDDPGALGAALDVVMARGPRAVDCGIPAESVLLDGTGDKPLLLALERQSAADPWMSTWKPYQRARCLEDLRWLARHAAAAVACDDPTIVRDVLGWLVGVRAARGLFAKAVIDSCYYLSDSIEQDAPIAAALLRSEADLAASQFGVGADGG